MQPRITPPYFRSFVRSFDGLLYAPTTEQKSISRPRRESLTPRWYPRRYRMEQVRTAPRVRRSISPSLTETAESFFPPPPLSCLFRFVPDQTPSSQSLFPFFSRYFHFYLEKRRSTPRSLSRRVASRCPSPTVRAIFCSKRSAFSTFRAPRLPRFFSESQDL